MRPRLFKLVVQCEHKSKLDKFQVVFCSSLQAHQAHTKRQGREFPSCTPSRFATETSNRRMPCFWVWDPQILDAENQVAHNIRRKALHYLHSIQCIQFVVNVSRHSDTLYVANTIESHNF